MHGKLRRAAMAIKNIPKIWNRNDRIINEKKRQMSAVFKGQDYLVTHKDQIFVTYSQYRHVPMFEQQPPQREKQDLSRPRPEFVCCPGLRIPPRNIPVTRPLAVRFRESDF